jgi:Crp-like helix-turn-helix domain
LEKVAAFLAEMDRRSGRPALLLLPMTRRDIADYLGLTIETVSRALSELRNRRSGRLCCMIGVSWINWPSKLDQLAKWSDPAGTVSPE